MTNKYKALPRHAMTQEAIIDRRVMERPAEGNLDDAALSVMTDLSQVTPFCIEPTASIEKANYKMIACGVRSLFVTDHEGSLLGLITASDILGEKPVQYIKEHGGTRIDILVQDIMIYKDKLNVLFKADVDKASVGDIVETMTILGRQHALVVKTNSDASETVCGIFSTTQIGRQLNTQLDPISRANTFADVNLAVLSK